MVTAIEVTVASGHMQDTSSLLSSAYPGSAEVLLFFCHDVRLLRVVVVVINVQLPNTGLNRYLHYLKSLAGKGSQESRRHRYFWN